MREPPEEFTFPVLASYKLDGFRALVGGDFKLYTRRLKLVQNYYTQDLFGRKAYLGFDGELIVGPPTAKGVFQTTSSGVTSEDGEPDVTFWVFDLWNRPGEPFERRLRELRIRVAEIGNPRIKVLTHETLTDFSDMKAYEAEALKLKYEGLIIRTRRGDYVNKRCGKTTPYMWKLKRFVDGEMCVTDVEEEMQNLNPKKKNELGLSKRSSHKANKKGKGIAGVLVGFDTITKQTVRAGSGMTAKQKAEFWKLHKAGKMVGSIVKYKHFAQSGVKEKRRHSVFLGIRHPDDV